MILLAVILKFYLKKKQGSGFGGVMAVYARSRYPHLVHAAWSSSGFFETAVYSSGKILKLEEISVYLSQLSQIVICFDSKYSRQN